MTEERDYLRDLDPEDPKSPAQQIANQLRAAILTRRVSPGEKLPSQGELLERYGVARETVRRALEILRADGLIISRQGAGSYVRAKTQRAVELRPHIEAAFEQPRVTIDFAGMSGETLRDAITETLDKIRIGRYTPESIAIRVLLSDMTVPMAIPSLAATQADDPNVRDRALRIVRRAADGIIDQVNELGDLGLVPSATVDVRVHSASPVVKLYIINQEEVFFGFYPVVERTVTIKKEPVAIYDVMGKDVPLVHYSTTDDESSHGSQFVTAARQWFDSLWDTIAREYES